jgi:regulator of replication initiation timing
MPERVKKLEGQLLSLSSQIDDLQNNVGQLVQILKRESAAKENCLYPLKDDRYIS